MEELMEAVVSILVLRNESNEYLREHWRQVLAECRTASLVKTTDTIALDSPFLSGVSEILHLEGSDTSGTEWDAFAVVKLANGMFLSIEGGCRAPEDFCFPHVKVSASEDIDTLIEFGMDHIHRSGFLYPRIEQL